MVNRFQKVGAWAGVAGSVFILLAFLIVGLAYQGRVGESYSMGNHFVSELGEVGISEMAWLFNLSLILGGIGILLSFIALSLYMHGWFRYLILVLGFITGLSGTLVGFFPMNQLETHITIALTFFNTGWMVTGAFSLYLLFSKQQRFPRWLAIPGIVAAVAFIAFSLYRDNFVSGTMSLEELLGAARPAFWGLATLEWVVVLAVNLWVLLVSAVMLRMDNDKK
jgi:hypothetical membrane protein